MLTVAVETPEDELEAEYQLGGETTSVHVTILPDGTLAQGPPEEHIDPEDDREPGDEDESVGEREVTTDLLIRNRADETVTLRISIATGGSEQLRGQFTLEPAEQESVEFQTVSGPQEVTADTGETAVEETVTIEDSETALAVSIFAIDSLEVEAE